MTEQNCNTETAVCFTFKMFTKSSVSKVEEQTIAALPNIGQRLLQNTNMVRQCFIINRSINYCTYSLWLATSKATDLSGRTAWDSLELLKEKITLFYCKIFGCNLRFWLILFINNLCHFRHIVVHNAINDIAVFNLISP